MEAIYYRDYRPEDYDDALLCINDFYDGGYPYPDYIEKDSIEKRIADGELLFTLAVTGDDKVVGTFAAMHREGDFHGGVLLFLRTVLTEYRGRGISSGHFGYLLDYVGRKFKNVNCYYADLMTHDSISQSSLVHRGFVFCGLRCFAYKNEIIAPKLKFPENTKMTQAVYCLPIKRPEVSIFVPEAHKEFIKSIYDKLGAPVFLKEDIIEPEGVSDYFVDYDKRNNFSEIIVRKAGKDFRLLEDKLSEFLSDKQTLVAYINMKDEGSNYVYERLKKLGFYFSGISPLFYDYEYLIMSQSENCTENFEDVCIFINKEEVIKYIKGGRTGGK